MHKKMTKKEYKKLLGKENNEELHNLYKGVLYNILKTKETIRETNDNEVKEQREWQLEKLRDVAGILEEIRNV